MTPSGELMMRVKARVICGDLSERAWRNRRAEGLAKMIAWHRRHRNSEGESYLRRIILEDIVPDIGWPRWTWLKPAVRGYEASIRHNLSGFRLKVEGR